MYKMAMIPEIHFVNRLVRKLVDTATFVAGSVANVLKSNVHDSDGYGFYIFNQILQKQSTFS